MIKIYISTCFFALSCCMVAANTTPGITVVYDVKKKAVNIKWQQKISGIKSYIIQRSNDNMGWIEIARQDIVNFNPNLTFQFFDNKSFKGEIYYRLKCIMEKGQAEYSTSVMINIGATNNNWVMYPVPVGDVITLQYKGSNKITGVINVFIQNVSGRILTRLRSASLNTIIQIPVNNLGKGIYDIRIVVEDEVLWNQRFIK